MEGTAHPGDDLPQSGTGAARPVCQAGASFPARRAGFARAFARPPATPSRTKPQDSCFLPDQPGSPRNLPKVRQIEMRLSRAQRERPCGG